MNRTYPSPRLHAPPKQKDQETFDKSPLGFEIAISRGGDDDENSENVAACLCTAASPGARARQEEIVDVSSSSNCCLEEDLAAPLPSRKALGYDDEEDLGAMSSVHSALSTLSVGKPIRNKRASFRRSVCSSTRRSTCSNSTESNCSSIYTSLSVGRPIRNKRSSIVTATNLRRSTICRRELEEPEEEDAYARHKALIALKFAKTQQDQQHNEEEDNDLKALRSSSFVSALSSSGSGVGDEEFTSDSCSRRNNHSRISRQSFRRPCARMTARRSSNSADSLQAALVAARAVVISGEED